MVKILERIDGWMNLFTGMGIAGRDNNKASQAVWQKYSREEFETLYAADDVLRTLCDELPTEATREFIKFTHPNQEIVDAAKNYFENKLIRERVFQAWSWGRIYGGAGLLIVTEAVDLSTPLDVKRETFKGLTCFNRFELQADTNIEKDMASKNFGLPIYYNLTSSAIDSTSAGSQILARIHHSRIIRFGGLPLPRHKFQQNNYWDDSVITSVVDASRSYNNAHNYSVAAISDFSVPIIKMKNLAAIMMSPDGESKVRKRIDIMNMCKSVMRMVIIDGEEDMSFINRSVAGLKDLVDKAEDRLVVASKMPRSKILGDTARGLGNEGKHEDRKWYDFVKSQQELYLQKPLNQLTELMQLDKEGPTKGKIDPELSWDFISLWQLTEQEKSDIYLKTAQADAVYIDRFVIQPSDAARRFESDKFNTQLEAEEMEIVEQEEATSEEREEVENRLGGNDE